jgi:hypothetical protein
MPAKSSGSVKIFYPEFSREELIDKLRKGIPLLKEKLPLCLVSLFGSWARGNYTAASDIDLLVVYSGPEREDAFAIVKTSMEIEGLEPHVYSERAYLEMKPLISRMLEKSVPILGNADLV